MSIHRLFSAHPASVGESYLQHLRVALGFSGRLLFAGIACLVHAVFPFLCERTGSNCILELHERMVSRRRRVSRFPVTDVTVGESVRSAAR
jgi:hypothetical protein